MSDVRQKAKDLLRLALDDQTTGGERGAATFQLLKLIDKYDLLSAGGKPINVATDVLNKITDPSFMEGIADRAEKFASTFDRVTAAAKRVAGTREPKRGDGGRRYR